MELVIVKIFNEQQFTSTEMLIMALEGDSSKWDFNQSQFFSDIAKRVELYGEKALINLSVGSPENEALNIAATTVTKKLGELIDYYF